MGPWRDLGWSLLLRPLPNAQGCWGGGGTGIVNCVQGGSSQGDERG